MSYQVVLHILLSTFFFTFSPRGVLAFTAQCVDSGIENLLLRDTVNRDIDIDYVIVCRKSRIYNGSNAQR